MTEGRSVRVYRETAPCWIGVVLIFLVKLSDETAHAPAYRQDNPIIGLKWVNHEARATRS
jgi:hypothetical protein